MYVSTLYYCKIDNVYVYISSYTNLLQIQEIDA